MGFADRVAAAGKRFAHVVTATVPALPKPPAGLFDEAASVAETRAEHDRLALDLPAFNALEIVGVPGGVHHAGEVRVAAWNAERLKHAEASAALVGRVGPDILLLTETDLGMARSGNRHTTAELAKALGMSYAYGVEFLEFGLGDDRERVWHKGAVNRVGFHGNALLSRLPIRDAALIRLDDGAVWWLGAERGQRRLGWRMAIAANIETSAGPLVAVVVHLESKSDPEDRARQIARLIETVDILAGDHPIVIGGDCNTKALPLDGSDWLAEPGETEPLLALMAKAGFDWSAANTGDATMRTLPDGRPRPPFRKLDWLFTRGLGARRPVAVPAVDAKGHAISDHDLIAVDLAIG